MAVCRNGICCMEKIDSEAETQMERRSLDHWTDDCYDTPPTNNKL